MPRCFFITFVFCFRDNCVVFVSYSPLGDGDFLFGLCAEDVRGVAGGICPSFSIAARNLLFAIAAFVTMSPRRSRPQVVISQVLRGWRKRRRHTQERLY